MRFTIDPSGFALIVGIGRLVIFGVEKRGARFVVCALYFKARHYVEAPAPIDPDKAQDKAQDKGRGGESVRCWVPSGARK